MTFLIGGANSITGGYEVANSCRFNTGDSPDHRRTFGSAGNRDKWTFSTWVKKCRDGVGRQAIFSGYNDSNNFTEIRFENTEQIHIRNMTAGSLDGELKTNAKYRDPSAWMHILFHYDSGNGTEGDRMKLWVNGTEVTSFATDDAPDQNTNASINGAFLHTVGQLGNDGNYLNGYLAEVVFLNDDLVATTSFGEFDEDSPTIWKPINVSGLTPGTNGFYLDFEASGNLGNDAFGGTDWTETNIAAGDQSQDSPTNNFCTINPLDTAVGTFDISEGNLKYERTSDTESWKSARGTLGIPNAGKWYWEMAKVGGAVDGGFGGIATDVADLTQEVTGFWGFHDGASNENYTIHNSGYTDVGASYNISDDDIIQIAFDRDNNKLWVGLNNSWGVNGGTPVTPSDPASGFLSISENMLPAFMIRGSFQCVANFGQDSSFAGNVTRQSNSDGNGFGDFYYTPPSGYLALCTKNIGSDGG